MAACHRSDWGLNDRLELEVQNTRLQQSILMGIACTLRFFLNCTARFSLKDKADIYLLFVEQQQTIGLNIYNMQ